MSRRTARGNRLGLALVGAVLVLAGAAALARGLDVWPDGLGSAGAPVTAQASRDFAADQAWFWPLLALVLLVIGLLALRWLAVQTRTEAVDALRLEPDPRRGTTRLPARAAAGAFADDLGSGGQLRRVNATLQSSPSQPRLHVRATMDSAADAGGFREQLASALDRHQRALELDRLDTTVILR